MGIILENIAHKDNELLKNHTTFRIGGPAKRFFTPENDQEIYEIIKYCKENNERYMILGNGSNVLFSDDGFEGYIIQIYNNYNHINVQNNKIYAGAGALLSKVAATARDNSLTGMEFAAGIPGTIGGAVVMNAGAYGGEMKDIVTEVSVLEQDGKVVSYSNDEMDFGYRHSIIDSNKVVLSVTIDLEKGEKKDIIQTMDSLKEARVSKQPLEYPSAGSTFKRPEGYFAGKLIQDSGLRGYRVGGAMVSEKHCGFVINYDNATCRDVVNLMDDVSRIVEEKYGVKLESEVKVVL